MTDHIKKGIALSKKSARKVKRELVYWVWVTVFVCMVIILAGNIISSQSISPLYFRLATDDFPATVTLLKMIKSFPEYPEVFSMASKQFGESIEEEVIAPKLEREKLIRKLEDALAENPNSRDVLYSLAILYQDNGDDDRAAQFMSKAKEIDPSVGKEASE